MSRLRQPFETKRRVTLMNGRTPGCWQRQLAGSLRHLADLRWFSLWVRGLIMTRLKLRDEPLLGGSLATLVDPAAPPVASSPEKRQSRQDGSGGLTRITPQKRTFISPSGLSGFSPSDAWSKRGDVSRRKWGEKSAKGARPGMKPREPSGASPLPQRDRSRPVSQGGHQRRTPPPFQLAPKAHFALLHRLAGDVVLPESPRRSRVRQFREAGSSKTAASSLLPPPPPDSRQAWLRQLASRVERSLRQNGLKAIPPAERVSAEQALSSQPLTLAGMWFVSVEGQTAPVALLAHLAGLSGGGEPFDRQAPATVVSPRPQGGVSPEPAARPGKKIARQTGATQVTGKPSSAGPVPEEGDRNLTNDPAAQDLIASSSNGAGQIGEAGRGAGSSASIAPPSGVSTLPSLHLPRRADTPAVPVAAATIRQEVKQEAATAEEDLTALAAKVKRILDEEARRYGIDV